ncbi:hypothetical protein CKM354_000098900 [Cercospora kikuchii]|uniref:Uncharacterized protein n=1 Tax=Cercospora kikuchii TaxID=84275 RepID=A0A9P3FCH3_9PEZI|nr:uncharacterized protein CKM354_000098900 [Cercospora kikuchii]GIZ37545.1 hypothetical protein CKM354_000098900 [Cercospora kikuchii]
MRHFRTSLPAAVVALANTLGAGAAQKTTSLTNAAQDLFDWSMTVNDLRFDQSYKYIRNPDKGPWSTRFTAWYVAGLLYRNNGSDCENAKAAIENIISCQYSDSTYYDTTWYGTFKLSPDQPDPTPDSDLYPPKIYGTYDPNWREFIGSQLVQVVEEFSSIIGDDLVNKIEDSLEIAAVGSMRRNGSFPEGDNLTPAYTNPAVMRAWYVGWIGARRNNQKFIDYANEQGKLIADLFFYNGSNVVSEYLSPTYYGMDVWALAGSIKYGAKDAVLTRRARPMLKYFFDDLADHYNPYLTNMIGPYDRAYSRDLTTNSAVINYLWWGLYGYGVGPQSNKQEADLLYDVAQGAALALIMDTAAEHISPSTSAKLTATGPWEGSRLITKQIYEDTTASDEVRTSTSWISSPLMIGGQVVNETVNRGEQYVPALVQWAGDKDHTPHPYMTFFSLYPTASTVSAIAGPNTLEISYPNTTQEGTNIFTFALAQVPPSWTLTKRKTITGFADLPCLNVTVVAPGLEPLPVIYGATLERNIFYNISYLVKDGFEGVPSMKFEFEYTC